MALNVSEGTLQYGELAKYYDAQYAWKDYEKEAHVLVELIRRYKRTSGKDLLDVGCGTGKHIQYLTRNFDCVGLDSSDAMLEQARKNIKTVRFVQGDMANFSLGRSFDVILCLFSAIGYVRTYSRLGRTLRNFSRHLRAGGVVIIEPWFTKTSWNAGTVHVVSSLASKDLKIVRVDFSGIRGNLSVLDEMTVVAKANEGISYYREKQFLGLFEHREFLSLMSKAGLRARYLRRSLAPGRGLFVGTKPRDRDGNPILVARKT